MIIRVQADFFDYFHLKKCYLFKKLERDTHTERQTETHRDTDRQREIRGDSLEARGKREIDRTDRQTDRHRLKITGRLRGY